MNIKKSKKKKKSFICQVSLITKKDIHKLKNQKSKKMRLDLSSQNQQR